MRASALISLAAGMLCPAFAQSQDRVGALAPSKGELSVTIQCARVPVQLIAWPQSEREMVCAAAEDAIRLLGQCDLLPDKSIIIELMSGAKGGGRSGETFGFFSAMANRVYVTSSQHAATMSRETPFAAISESEFRSSLIVHEVTHAVLHQHYKQKPKTRTALEYPAYVMQIASLSPTARKAFQSAVGAGPLRKNFLFNDIILAIDPYVFAALAHEHFKTFPGGCTNIRALLDGGADFVAMLE